MKNWKEIKAEANAKWTGFTIRAKTKAREIYEWYRSNPEEAAALASIGIVSLTAVGRTAKYVDRKIALKKEQDLKDLYVYDRSLGIYHELRRKLKPSEVRQIDARRANGESMTQILSSMRLLK